MDITDDYCPGHLWRVVLRIPKSINAAISAVWPSSTTLPKRASYGAHAALPNESSGHRLGPKSDLGRAADRTIARKRLPSTENGSKNGIIANALLE